MDKNTYNRSDEYLLSSHTQQISKIEKLASQLRKRSKETILASKRSSSRTSIEKLSFPSDLDIETHFGTLIPQSISMNDDTRFAAMKHKLMTAINTIDIKCILYKIRYYLSTDTPPVDSALQSGIIHFLLQYLKFGDSDIAYHAGWCINNAIAKKNCGDEMVELGLLESTLSLIKSPKENLKEIAIWIIGNLAGENIKLRNKVIDANIMADLMPILESSDNYKIATIRIMTWTISNIIRGRPNPPYEKISCYLAYLHTYAYSPDKETVLNALWAISYVTDCDRDNYLLFLNKKFLDHIVEFLVPGKEEFFRPCLRIVGNICAEHDFDIKCIMNGGFLHNAQQLAASIIDDHDNESLLKEILWIVSNMAAGTEENLQILFDEGFINMAFQLISGTYTEAVKNESLYIISNSCNHPNKCQYEKLTEMYAITIMANYLNENAETDKLTFNLIATLNEMLKIARSLGSLQKITTEMQTSGALEKIEKLMKCQNKEMADRCTYIIDVYFSRSTAMSLISEMEEGNNI